MTKVRALVEGAALREAIERADVEYETLVVATHHRMSRTQYWADEQACIVTEEWGHAHSLFHSALISGSQSPRLRDLAASLRDSSERYRRWGSSYAASSPRRDIASEHRALMQAVVDGDADRAVALLTDHINATTAHLVEYGGLAPVDDDVLVARSSASESA